MDAERFDAFLRALNATPSRRTTMRLLTGSILGGMVPLGAIAAQIGAKRKGKKKHKKGNKPGACRSLGAFCSGVCEAGPCQACCNNWCGVGAQTSDLLCCVKQGKPCPNGCAADQDCPNCCGSGYCLSDGTCF